MKILYELTYATRGLTGIPRDAISLAKILLEMDEFQTDLVLNPRSYTKRQRNKQKGIQWKSEALGDSLRTEPGRSAIPTFVTFGLILCQSLSLNHRVNLDFLDERMTKSSMRYLKILHKNELLQKTRLALIPISYLARFSRPRHLKPFELATHEYQVFIQQQLDPIAVGKKTIHVVRLHDFLPITHPQYFDQNGVKLFSKSLRIMLGGAKKIFVMDSESTANNFREYFGLDLDVRVIPCSVPAGELNTMNPKRLRKNQICMVNTIEPRKRVRLAIAGFHEAKKSEEISADWNLIIVGSEGWQESTLAANLRRQSFGKDIIFMENAPDYVVQEVLRESKIVLSAAVAEGFGLPPLEGMSNGCVPVVSDIPQHRETVRQNGFYFSGESSKAIAKAVGQAAVFIEDSGPEIEVSLQNYVKENYSEEVIGKMWSELLNSLKR